MTHPPTHGRNVRQRSLGPKRPSTIAELAEKAMADLWDDSKDFKYFLRLAEKHRKEGKESAKRGDLEGAFVELARAATLVLEKLPMHKDYYSMLNQTQRHNLGLNGQDILDNLGELKPTLVDRYDKWWRKRQEDGLDLDRTPNAPPPRTLDEEKSQSQPDRLHTEPQSTRAREEQLMAEELDRWRQQRKEVEARDQARDQAHEARRKAAVHAAQKAVNRPKLPPAPDLSFSRTPMQNAGYGTQNTVVFSDGRPSDEASRHRQHQEAMRAREEESARRQADKRRQEEDGNARWQREADDAARMARLNISNSSSSAAVPSGSAYYQFPPRIEYPTMQPNMRTTPNPNPPDRQAGYVDPYRVGPSMLPIESPSRYEGDSTDSESVYRHNYRRAINTRVTEQKTPTRNLRSPLSYPPPVTTTSPPPHAPIRYPALMSQHQKTQGYYPSLGSMFAESFGVQHGASLLFGPNANDSSKVNGSLYQNAPAAPPIAPQLSSSSSYGVRVPSISPNVVFPPPPQSAQTVHADPDRIIRPTDSKTEGTLKTVNLPRDCLPRFLAIAKVNTETNKETCGLLLGKDKGHKFTVTTLLIPKQSSTSDTCTMDEEELVLQFTEERSLITLGWIHTHPSQSCFMSSVDLHTHSGFQRMLPESFAVVCAPKSNPNFGIFRLTDPPGLQTILACNEKEAFHPHPDKPIYTDADKGHVHIKDGSLEIVDLR